MNSKLAMRQLKALGKLTEGRDIRLAAEWDEPWQVLIATILSAQTRDVRTIKICDVLFRKYDSIEKLARARLSSIEKVIVRVNIELRSAAPSTQDTSIIPPTSSTVILRSFNSTPLISP